MSSFHLPLRFSRKVLAAGVALLSTFGIFAFTLGSLAATADTVQNVSVTPYNSGAVLTWDALPAPTGKTVNAYEVSYGTSSVAEGLAGSYEATVNAGNAVTATIKSLTNGVKYYGAVKAVFSDGQKSASFSEEVTFTPSSVYSKLPAAPNAGTPENDTTAPVVESALALTKNMVRVKFSEAVKLPDVLPEVSFTITKNLDAAQTISVNKVVYKTDYIGQPNELVHKDVVWLTTNDPLAADAEYTVTVSASVADLAGNPLESGVTDYAIFSGTDRTDIPTEEQALTGTNPAPVAAPSVDAGTGQVLPKDTTAPENVTNFTVTPTAQEKDFALALAWQKSISPDVADQHLSQNLNNQGFGQWISLGKDTVSYNSVAAPKSEVQFKITALDQAGNESSGTLASIRLPALPSSGAPIGLLALGASLAVSGFKKLRRKK